MKGNPKLSVILPAYNEGDTIQEAIGKIDRILKNVKLDYELIVVDDGSLDDTRMKAVNYANNNAHVRVIGYGRNMGKGYAMKTGFEHAKGDSVIFLDSDLDIDPRQIVRYVEALRFGDVVVASKWHPQSRVEMPLMRKFLSFGFNALVKLLTGIKLRDTQTGLKAVRRKSLERVFSRLAVKRFAFDVELLALANLYGLKVVELPVEIRLTRKLFSLREVWRMFIDLLGIAYRLRVLKWYQR
ncbi:MAG: glycosyltransferase family 2 protein [Thermoprotei archaeon]